MPTSATSGMGCLLKKGGTTIAEITSINPNLTTGEAEVTPLDAPGRMEEWIATKTGAEINVELNFLPTPGAAKHETDILLDISNPAVSTSSPTSATYTIVWTDASATTWSFTAFWKSFSATGGRDSALTATGTLRVTGVIDWSL